MNRYLTKGTCSKQIDFELEDGIITSLKFYGGCNGNLKGISKILIGMKAEEVIANFKGITCGFRDTSCPDQLARALEEALQQN